MATQRNWEKEALDVIKKERQVTDLGANSKSKRIKDASNYATYEYTPSEKLDGDKRYYLAGTDSQIIQQTSLLQTIHDLLGQRLGYTIDFDEWFDDFEYEFQEGMTNKPWGQAIENRPKKIDLRDKEDYLQKGYHVIKFWKNRNNDKDSLILAGTYTELRQQLIDLMRQPLLGEENSQDRKIFPELKLISSSPYLVIEFREEEIPEGKRTKLRSEPTISLINFCEHESLKKFPHQEVITVADLKRFKSLVEATFYPNNMPYTVKRGNEIYSYSCWHQGLHTWIPFLNEISALEFYKLLVPISGFTFDDRWMSEGKATNPAKRYEVPADPITVAGEITYLPERFRKGDCLFWKAWIHLPQSRQKIILASRSVRSPVDYRLLE